MPTLFIRFLTLVYVNFYLEKYTMKYLQNDITFIYLCSCLYTYTMVVFLQYMYIILIQDIFVLILQITDQSILHEKAGHSNYIKYHAPWNFNSLVCFRVISENIFNFLHVYLGQAEPLFHVFTNLQPLQYQLQGEGGLRKESLKYIIQANSLKIWI